MTDSKTEFEIKHGGKSYAIPLAVVMFLGSSAWNIYSSFTGNSQTTAMKLSELSNQMSQVQSDTRELKDNVKELTKTVNQQNETTSNRLTVVEVKTGIK